MDICSDLMKRARATWNLLRRSESIRFSIGEETITDLNLLILKEKHDSQVITAKCPRHLESLIGSDWEWFLLSNDPPLSLRVQAKRLDAATLRYDGLGYKKNGTRQIDKLIDGCSRASHSPVPIYVFYNYWHRGAFNPPWNCGTYHKTPSLLGCGIAYAPAVKRILDAGSNRLVDIAEIMYPWSCLFCCTIGRGEERSVSARARLFVEGVLASGFGADFSDQRRFSDQLPAYVSKVLESEPLTDDEWLEAGVNRITVITDA